MGGKNFQGKSMEEKIQKTGGEDEQTKNYMRYFFKKSNICEMVQRKWLRWLKEEPA